MSKIKYSIYHKCRIVNTKTGLLAGFLAENQTFC